VRRAFLAALLAMALAAPARAVLVDLDASDLGGNTLDFAVLDGGVVAIDPDFVVATPMRIVLVPEVGDALPIVWNALVDNLTGELWSRFAIESSNARIGVGSAVANGGAVDDVELLPRGAQVHFALPGEAAGLDLGAPFGTGTDWTLTPAGTSPIQLYLVPIAVPEPVTALLVGAGVAALALRRRA